MLAETFQSHLGSITTAARKRCVHWPSSVSIPSWFDYNRARWPGWASGRRVSIPSWFDYNLLRAPLMTLSIRCFNPILVRLQQGRQVAACPGVNQFQSHLGSITTRGRQRRRPPDRMFQSHLGSITTVKTRRQAASMIAVSIPSWFDYNLNTPPRCPSAAVVSIPSWFDYNELRRLVYEYVDLSFNPILVRLQLAARHTILSFKLQFQSHLGSITTPSWAATSRTAKQFQSHLGSITTSTTVHISFPPPPVSIPSWFDYNCITGLMQLQSGCEFQSHLGSITTEAACPSPPAPLGCFNPILVRLQREIVRYEGTSRRGFNPILVRLQRYPSWCAIL